jgi:hypothetical protein
VLPERFDQCVFGGDPVFIDPFLRDEMADAARLGEDFDGLAAGMVENGVEVTEIFKRRCCGVESEA